MGSITAEHRVANLGSIQIVHINGERKGDIEHFLPGTITFGRHPNCDIVFPRESLTVSRVHARLECDDKQCRLVGLGGNGTYVNGELVDIAVLSTGDVVTFSEHGPKLSFLFQSSAQADANNTGNSKIQTNNDKTEVLNRMQDDATSVMPDIKDITPLPGRESYVAQHATDSVNQAPALEFTLQFGGSLQSFQKQKIYVGRNHNSDFLIDHPRLLEQHARFYFSGNQCYVANATALKLIWINGELLDEPRRLKHNDVIMLNSGGPRLIYKGEGRLQEYRKKNEDDEGLMSTIREPAGIRQSFLQRLLNKLKS